MDRREAAFVAIGGVNLAAIFHSGGECQRLAAGAGTKVDYLLAGLGIGQEPSKLRALVLDFDLALDEERLGMNGRAFGIGAKADAERRPARRLGRKVFKFRQYRIALRRERIDTQI